MNEKLLVRREGRVLRLTLNRPEARNALDSQLCELLLKALEEANSDAAAGSILLDAAGSAFCAGMDLKESGALDSASLPPLHVGLFSFGRNLTKPMVAAVQGPALGGGTGLALNAHIVIAAGDSRFGLTETRIGLWPYAIFPVVAEAVGTRKATELAITGRIISAAEAAALGMVDEVVVPAERLADRAMELASQLARGSGEALAAGLGFLRDTQGLPLEQIRRLAAKRRLEAQRTADFREGVEAFRQKREPVWPSHDF
ncbi:MAG: enoyl-CoA hydratase/isomerase family protein [Bryobacteraceae bacterium]|jgi:methylglutaconyl-CoA hydratase